MEKRIFESPIGLLYLTVENSHVIKISYDDKVQNESGTAEENRVMNELVTELTDYFSGKLQRFQVNFKLSGTAFEQAVYEALTEIPYGDFWSYKQVASHIQNASSVRAVGQANRKNPLPIIIPCHRVVQEGGQLGGYNGADYAKKIWLLEFEMNHKTDFWS
ncbi:MULTISPECIES: methylated-DNA--[protein]-cysteine S-methyltransferase [Listeria]|uniref:methylated-DNA--[protein]-cysteine S-methyltransferase n=1 Tax=Listeria TaxID=1637 RepID=UPI000B587D3C|nr:MULTISPECIES: methylated-DNA--[protein]-cysteine S-methyltransferase [Listeria]